MKSREELIAQIHDDSFGDDSTWIAVDSTIYAVLEYIDDLRGQWGDTPVVGKVLDTLRANIVQFASKS
jgi:hypothetical protein